jgi:O-acetyl-ADP-ribose deacetylase (regulator of RNase III)
MEVVLCDKNPEVVKAWHFFFDRGGRVTIKEGDMLEAGVSAVVLPVNSFGIMDDGFAEEINKKTDGMLESRARKLILDKYAGEIPVGMAEVISSGLDNPKLVVLTPTVRVPQRMSQPGISTYLATRAALRSVAAYVRNGGTDSTKEPLDTVGFVGLGTGQGGVSPATAAFQMYEAFCQIVLGQVPNFATLEAATAHDAELRKSRFM